MKKFDHIDLDGIESIQEVTGEVLEKIQYQVISGIRTTDMVFLRRLRENLDSLCKKIHMEADILLSTEKSPKLAFSYGVVFGTLFSLTETIQKASEALIPVQISAMRNFENRHIITALSRGKSSLRDIQEISGDGLMATHKEIKYFITLGLVESDFENKVPLFYFTEQAISILALQEKT